MRVNRFPPLLIFILLAGLLLNPAHADPVFPQLTGQVMDTANMISPATEAQIRTLLDSHMNATSNQIVVATVPDLQGYDIATFGYQLGRFWKLGQKEEDNGVLLLIARQERQFRIEVGYGLEGELTDAISSNIIYGVIRPELKRGNFDGGVTAGVEAIIQALGGEYKMRERSNSRSGKANWVSLIVFLLIVFGSMMGGGGGLTGRRTYRRGGGIGGYYGGGLGGGGFGGGGGGGFSGGGGGFGGGGASGGW